MTAAAKRWQNNLYGNKVIRFIFQYSKALTLEIPESRTEAESADSLPPSTKNVVSIKKKSSLKWDISIFKLTIMSTQK